VHNPENTSQAEVLRQVKDLGIAVQPVDRNTLSRRTGTQHHQGIALQARPKHEGDEQQLTEHLVKLVGNDANRTKNNTAPLLLILDQIQDPHNFGACLRTADAAGVDAVIVAKDNSSPITPVVQKVASGAVETLDLFRVTNLARSMDIIKEQGIWLLGTSDKARESIYTRDLVSPLAFVMGAEGKGLRNLTEKKCDALVKLPMAGSLVSSLNVSVATGVCLFEAVRQRQESH
jgi:23S rRNA (guanosine2251-2'-O)-methyltransferase